MSKADKDPLLMTEKGATPPPIFCLPLRSDPPGFSRKSARTLSLLPFLLLGFLCLMNATPAAAQTSIWSATLTTRPTDNGNRFTGCRNARSGNTKCSDTSTLTDDDLTVSGTDYQIISIYAEKSRSNSTLVMQWDQDVRTALDSYKLCAGTKQYAFADATHAANDYTQWQASALWSDGDMISLSIGTSCPSYVPPPTVLLSATPNPVKEGHPVTLTATLSEALTIDVNIPLKFIRGTTGSWDYGATPHISIPSGQTTGTVTIPTRPDHDHDDEIFTVEIFKPNLTALLTAGSMTSVMVTIRDTPPSEHPAAPTATRNAGLSRITLLTDTASTNAATGNIQKRVEDSLSPSFHSDILNYAVRVDAGVKRIQVGVTPQYPNSIAYLIIYSQPAIRSAPYTRWVELDTDVKRIRILVDTPGAAQRRIYELTVLRGGVVDPYAEDQTTVWSSTLTAKELSSSLRGCDDSDQLAANKCLEALTENEFSYSGTRYGVRLLSLGFVSGDSNFLFGLNKAIPSAMKNLLTLHVGKERALPLSSSTFSSQSGNTLQWLRYVVGGWGVGGTVLLKLTGPTSPVIPAVSLLATPNPVKEGHSVTLTATLSAALPVNTFIPLKFIRSTADSLDYGATPHISIPSGQTTGTVTLKTKVNVYDDDDETFTVAIDEDNLSSRLTAGSLSSVTVTIEDYLPPVLRELSLFAVDNRPYARRLGFVEDDLEPTFHEDTLNYTVRVDDWVRYIRVGAEARYSNPEDPTKVLVNGEPKKPFSSFWVELKDVTPIEIVVRTPLGESRTYAVRVLRGNAETPPDQTPPDQTPPDQTPPDQTPTTGGGGGPPSGGGEPQLSSDASLSGLHVSEGDLMFSPGTRDYKVTVGLEVSEFSLTPEAGHPDAEIEINGVSAQSGEETRIDLGEDEETVSITITVTAPDGETAITYTVRVARGEECGINDKEALTRFYRATGGDEWTMKDNWNTENPLGEWYGVSTDENEKAISLLLADNNLEGKIPREFLCLAELKELALWGNEGLSGHVPENHTLATERAALLYIARALSLNAEWFDTYEDPYYDFPEWHDGVATDDGRVTGLSFSGEDISGVIPVILLRQLERLETLDLECSDITLGGDAPAGVEVKEGCDEEEDLPGDGGGGCALGDQGSGGAPGILLLLLLAVAYGRGAFLKGRRGRNL